MNKNVIDRNKILLVLLPFWTPLIPPQGIGQLKIFLKNYGYNVKTADANVRTEFKEAYQQYFSTIKKYVPERNWGNLYNIGHDVLRNHMMAYFNYHDGVGDETQYYQLLKSILYHTYYRDLDDEQVLELDRIIKQFYSDLEKYILDLVEAEKPGVFGLTAHLGTLGACMFSFKQVKAKYNQIMTIIGGSVFAGELPPGSPDFDYFLEKTPYIDKIVMGEGENLLLKILKDELPASQRVFTLEDINAKRLDIEQSELPDLSDFELERYPFNAAYISKSCPYKCKFCSVAGFFGDYRERSIKRAVDHFEELLKRHGIQLFHLLDSLVNPFIDALSEELIRRDMSVYMDGYLRVSDDVGNREKTLQWRRGGLYRTRLGIETGSQRLLNLMAKEITVEQSKAAISSLAYAGIKTTAYFVIGFPGETEADFQQTLDFIEEMRADIWQVECNPFYYYYTGQHNSDIWADKRLLLYPGYARNFLINQTWILNCDPTREVRFQRMFRLVEHCKKLDIPNPYTIEELYLADERWKTLHENAVPSVIEFEKKGVYINENKYIKKLIPALNTQDTDKDFMF